MSKSRGGADGSCSTSKRAPGVLRSWARTRALAHDVELGRSDARGRAITQWTGLGVLSNDREVEERLGLRARDRGSDDRHVRALGVEMPAAAGVQIRAMRLSAIGGAIASGTLPSGSRSRRGAGREHGGRRDPACSRRRASARSSAHTRGLCPRRAARRGAGCSHRRWSREVDEELDRPRFSDYRPKGAWVEAGETLETVFAADAMGIAGRRADLRSAIVTPTKPRCRCPGAHRVSAVGGELAAA